jgi:hypothetical protein
MTLPQDVVDPTFGGQAHRARTLERQGFRYEPLALSTSSPPAVRHLGPTRGGLEGAAHREREIGEMLEVASRGDPRHGQPRRDLRRGESRRRQPFQQCGAGRSEMTAARPPASDFARGLFQMTAWRHIVSRRHWAPRSVRKALRLTSM